MKIPKQLQNEKIGFVLLGNWNEWKNRETNETTQFEKLTEDQLISLKDNGWTALGKAPFEIGWQRKPYHFDDLKLLEHIKNKNFGVIGGFGNLRIIDVDDKSLIPYFEKAIGKTYTIETGTGGRHFYFYSDYNINHVFINSGGELRANNYQVVSAPCIHPLGIKYKIIDESKIKTISEKELKKIIEPYLRKEESLSKFDKPKDTSHSGLEYRRIIAMLREGKTKEQIAKEMTAYSKWMTSTDAYRNMTYEKAKAFVEQEEKVRKDLTEEVKIIWDKELEKYEEEEKDWIIDKLIPINSVIVLTGKRGTLKTFITLLMAYNISSGTDFLNQFSTRKGGVIYLDKENGLRIIKSRAKMIKNGLELTEEDLKVGFICFSQLKIDKSRDISLIEKLIESHNPLLLIIDTYRRGISFDENDAGAVSKLFVDTLRPLVEKYKLSILLIHHNRKGGYGESVDEMDEIRGSSDLANYSDIILKTERKGGYLILKQLKNRGAMEEPPIKISADFEENNLKMNFEGEYKKQSKSDKCVEILSLWLAENQIKQFKTGDAKEIAFKSGIKLTNFKNALQIMCDIGEIENIGFGNYKIRK